jgi:hypothetical protein
VRSARLHTGEFHCERESRARLNLHFHRAMAPGRRVEGIPSLHFCLGATQAVGLEVGLEVIATRRLDEKGGEV